MKVAFISTMTAAPWGGSEALWSATAREVLARGGAAGLSTLSWPAAPAAIADLTSRGATWWPRRDAAPERRGWTRRVAALTRRPAPTPSPFAPVFEFQPDVVCISQGGTFDFLLHDDLCDLLSRSALPYVVLCRFNSDDLPIHEFLRPRAVAFLTGARHLAFAAERNLRTAERQIGARLPRASVVQSPLGLRDVAALPFPAEEPLRLASVARLDAAYKGQDLLLQSFGEPAWQGRQWNLSLYGDGPDRPSLEALTRFYGLEGRVYFHGHVDDVAGIWRSHHLMVLPSRQEGTPQSLLQAMLCGRAAVATDVGGVSDWLVEGASGFVAEAATAPSIGRALARAWESRSHWDAMGRTAHDAALARLDRTPAVTLLHLLETALR